MTNVKHASKLPARASVVLRPAVDGNAKNTGVARTLTKRLGFEGKKDTSVTITGDSPAVTVLIGVGTAEAFEPQFLRAGIGAALRSLETQKSVIIDLSGLSEATLTAGSNEVAEADELTQAAAEGALLGLYSFTEHKSAEPSEPTSTVTIVHPGGGKRGIERGIAVGAAVCLARDFVNEPGGTLTPAEFALRSVAAADEAGLSSEVLGENEIEAEGFGGLMAVNKGSEHPARFLKLTWTPRHAVASVGLVGKGVTFDAGGLSIKPSEGMMTMKCDMGGAAAVIATMTALPALDVPVEVVAYVPMTDNMLGPDATRPGDVFTAHNGKTVEVLNTDAEGRLILADALSVASEASHDVIVDVATLTGAAVVALGTDIAAVLSNDELLSHDILAAGERSGEPFWPLPLPQRYRSLLDSPVADLKNIGTRFGGTLTAGLFLSEFVSEETSWAHLDIAGPAFRESAQGENPKGATGFAVRTLIEWINTLGYEASGLAAPDNPDDD